MPRRRSAPPRLAPDQRRPIKTRRAKIHRRSAPIAPRGGDYPVRLSTSRPRAPRSPRPHHRSHQKLSPLANLPSARLKRPRTTPLPQHSFASFCNGEPRACRALPQLLGKKQPRVIIVRGHQPPSRHPQQQTLSRDPRTSRPLRRQRRPRHRWCVHAGLISVTRRAPRLNEWRRHPRPPARHPSSLSGMSRQRSRCFCVSHVSR